MTDAQTEARAIAQRLMLPDEDVFELAVDIIATTLTTKDAEMEDWKRTATEYASELHSLRSQLAEARKALEWIEVRTRSVPSDTAEDDKRDKYHANSIARRALEGGTNE